MADDIIVADRQVTVEVVTAPASSIVDIATTGPPGVKGDKGDTGATGAQGDTGAQGPQGTPGPASMAYCPMVPGRWWYTNPFTAGSSLALNNDQVVWQPWWSGQAVKLAGVSIGFVAIADTAGQTCYFALYTDANCWPGNFIADLANLTTTTTASNQGRSAVCNQPVTPNTLYWIAYNARGGTAHPSMRTCAGGHPLVPAFFNTALPTTAATSPINGLYVAGALFPASAPVPGPGMNGHQACARLVVLPA